MNGFDFFQYSQVHVFHPVSVRYGSTSDEKAFSLFHIISHQEVARLTFHVCFLSDFNFNGLYYLVKFGKIKLFFHST